MNDDAPAEGKLYDKGLTLRLLRWTRPYRWHMVACLIAMVLLSFSSNAVPWLTRMGVDQFIQGGQDALPMAERIAGLQQIALWMFALALSVFVMRTFQLYLMRWVGEWVVRDMRSAVYAKILRLPMRYFDQVPVGRLMTRVTSDMDALQQFVTQGVVGLASSLMLLLGVTIFTLAMNWKLALTLFLVLPVLFGVMTYINVLARKAYREVRTRQSILNTYLQENITGMLAVQLFNREKQTREKFDECNEKLEQGFRESVRVFSFYFPSLEVMNALAILLVSLVCGWLILNGHEQIGTLFAFLMYIREFFRPLEELSDKSNIFQQAMASAERIFALLDEVETVADPATPVKIESFKGEVEFDGVSFAYDDKNWILNDVSFHLKPGESLALVGATGAGKTSIISLIARFYDVQKGAVKIDGEDVRNYTQTELRRRVGTVLQDPFIFSGNIADNIGMHNPEIDRDRIIEAAKYVNAHRFIVQLPEGYDTNLSERGSNLSTGQKQLLAMARVLVQNPDFLLILDEATANVDTETEQLIQSALEKVMHGRTTIIIAHRLSTIKDVDRILVMRKGEVIEEGNHRELLEQDGYYRTLYELLAHSVT